MYDKLCTTRKERALHCGRPQLRAPARQESGTVKPASRRSRSAPGGVAAAMGTSEQPRAPRLEAAHPISTLEHRNTDRLSVSVPANATAAAARPGAFQFHLSSADNANTKCARDAYGADFHGERRQLLQPQPEGVLNGVDPYPQEGAQTYTEQLACPPQHKLHTCKQNCP